MAGVVYLILTFMLGWELASVLFENKKTYSDISGISQIWIRIPTAFGLGTLASGWGTYMCAWLASEAGSEKPLIYGNAVVMIVIAVVLAAVYHKRRIKNEKIWKVGCAMTADKSQFCTEAVIFGMLAVFLTVMMFYVFYIKDGVLYSGYTVYGDYAPHTAMMRSFSKGNNFPTEYPHFGGEDVKYHFMFQFFTGNLEFLGIRLDIAYNMLSVMALLGFLMFLYCIARRLTKSVAAGWLTILFFFFRSSFSFFRFVYEHFQAGDLWETLRDNTSFIGYTTNENWGLWNFNVYLNQRHLAFGLLIASIVIWMFLDWLDVGCRHEEKGVRWLCDRFFTKNAWICRNPENALMAGLFLGLTSFWNGAAVIGSLLILMGLAIFSDGKLDYLIMAVTTIIFSVLQTKIFISGNAVSPSFYWGFLSEDKSILGVLGYILQMSGIFFAGALFLVFVMRNRKQKSALMSFLFPAIFAFLVSLTPDIAVNHKYIMISFAFGFIFWAWAVVKLWNKKIYGRVIAILTAFCLTITGVYDFVIIIRNNGTGHRVAVSMESELTEWLAENLTKGDLILTPEYSISEVTMSGAMMYLGWPYYAWSAGYDTYDRAAKAKVIYGSTDRESIMHLVEEEEITYILFEEGMEFEGESCREDVIASAYKLVYETEDRRIRIYET